MDYGNAMVDELVETIRRLCREKRVSITQMENDLGFSNGLISRWCKTKTSPSFDKIVAIMKYLNITYDELMGGELQSGTANFSSNQDPKIDYCKKLLKDSEAGRIDWKDICDEMSFHISFEQIFPDWYNYHAHRIFYTKFGYGCFFIALQWNECTLEMNVNIYMLTDDGLDPEILPDKENSAKKILKYADKNLYEEIVQKKSEKMKEDYLMF